MSNNVILYFLDFDCSFIMGWTLSILVPVNQFVIVTKFEKLHNTSDINNYALHQIPYTKELILKIANGRYVNNISIDLK